jgi:Uma2 family endonuclease
LATLTKLLTAEDLYDFPDEPPCELVDGVLITLSPPGPRHGEIQLSLGSRLRSYVRERNLGKVVTEVGFILRRNPDTVRAPDIAFVRSDLAPPGDAPVTFWEFAPDLAVEIRSPSNTPAEIQAKVREYLEGGSKAVLIITPEARTAEVVRTLTDRRLAGPGDELDLRDIVPGFHCPIEAIFE